MESADKTRQYPRAKELRMIERLKLVEKLHRRGMTPKGIALELDYSVSAASIDVRMIRDQAREFENHMEFLKDVTKRTAELLTRYNEQEAILWKQLDWANEWVIQRDGFGQPLIDHTTGEPEYGPRKPGTVRMLVSQISSINKNQAELLGILQKNADVTIKLEQTEQTQVIILEGIQEADPVLFMKIRRQLQAMKETMQTNKAGMPVAGVGRKLEEVIDVDFEEKPVRKALNG
jgi:hypothetical protein